MAIELGNLELLDVGFSSSVIVIWDTAALPAPITPTPVDDDLASWFTPDSLPQLAFDVTQRAVNKWRSQI